MLRRADSIGSSGWFSKMSSKMSRIRQDWLQIGPRIESMSSGAEACDVGVGREEGAAKTGAEKGGLWGRLARARAARMGCTNKAKKGTRRMLVLPTGVGDLGPFFYKN